jgi:phosphatidate cytidylyltransferase
MNSSTSERLFGWHQAFDHPVTLGTTLGIGALLLLVPIMIGALSRSGRVSSDHRRELLTRYYSWLVIVPVLLAPILLGAFWTILGVCLLSILCFREFARVTGLSREKAICFVVVAGIVLLTLTTLDNWYGLFVALTPQVIVALAVVAIIRDEPKGYVQRLALGVLGFVLFGTCLGHLGYLANDTNYRQYIILILLCVELNDVFAYVAGKTWGRHKLAPHTSPNKTVAGALGAIVMTTLLVVCLGYFVFRGTVLASWPHLIAMGILISVAGQFGDLMMSSIKRDVGIKDMGATIPGHGGLLDRFDSLILVAPLMFHYINFFLGLGTGVTQRVFTAQ